jgi:anti-sigma factor RsiW
MIACIVSDDSTARQPPQIEQLVAYLDGELDAVESAAIEKQLRQDSELRRTAEALDRTWGMLDALEPVVARNEFSQQTMNTVIATYSRPVQEPSLSVRRLLSALFRRQSLTWCTIGVFGALCGLGLSNVYGPSEQSAEAAQMLSELDMLARYPRYRIIPDIDSLERLHLPSDNSSGQESTP